VASADQGTGEPDGVTLMTVHMAKGSNGGRDAAGLEDGLFPLARSAGRARGSRGGANGCATWDSRAAREKTVFSWARTRYRTGRLELSEPSRFLEALPAGVWKSGARRRCGTEARAGGAARAGRGATRAPAELDWEIEASQDAPRYAAGERVRHASSGGGVVRAVSGSAASFK